MYYKLIQMTSLEYRFLSSSSKLSISLGVSILNNSFSFNCFTHKSKFIRLLCSTDINSSIYTYIYCIHTTLLQNTNNQRLIQTYQLDSIPFYWFLWFPCKLCMNVECRRSHFVQLLLLMTTK